MLKLGSSRLVPVALATSALLISCGGGGGGGSSGGGNGLATPTESAAPEIQTFATTGEDGLARRVDLIAGPVVPGTDPGGSVSATANQVIGEFLNSIMTTDGVDLDGNLVGGDETPYAGFESYAPGLPPVPGSAGRIYGANNLYDLFQTTTGAPQLQNVFTTGGPPFTGGDSNLDGFSEGGPGLFSNAATPFITEQIYPVAAVFPNAMGERDDETGSARGPSDTDQHQFIQIEFPYRIDTDSIFNSFNPDNSFLGDSAPGATPNVFVQRHWVALEGENVITDAAHAPGIAIVGGVTALQNPVTGEPVVVDAGLSNLPPGVAEKAFENNVLTYIAHEDPAGISGTPSDLGEITADNVLILPDPTQGLGGRVFGASTDIPSSVNDFGSDGDDLLGVSDANYVGFISFEIERLRSRGETFNNVYFHSFGMSQAFVTGDTDTFPQANDATDAGAVNFSFNRGAAVAVNPQTPSIGIDVAGSADLLFEDTQDPQSNIVSTRARFRVDFDKEVVPNSIGFSRRHTIHSVPGRGVIFPFNGNTRPIPSPSEEFVSGVGGAPLAPSIFLAVNQPTSVAVNNPLLKNVNPDPTVTDNGLPVGNFQTSGLFPGFFNELSSLPRGVVPCDIYPVNQNNLQAYIVEPLVDLPPGSVVTVGVCMPGLGTSNNNLPTSTLPVPYVPADPTNFGNFTRSGTVFTPWQGITPVGSGNPAITQVVQIIGNATIVKVNAGPMDLEGNLFFGGTGDPAIDVQINGNPNDDETLGGWNVCRTFQVGNDLEEAYVNAPVAPQAIVVGFGPKGLGAIDLNGTGFTTNAPGGGGDNLGNENLLVVSRYLQPPVSGLNGTTNWASNGSLAAGNHQRAFGVMGRYTSGNCANCNPTSTESNYAVGQAIRSGPLTPTPGVNEGSSGFETMVRDSFGSQFLTDDEDVALVNDVVIGEFLDTVFFDPENPFATVNNHRTYNTPVATAVTNNTISDPPTPNPPPMRFPVGLPHTAVIFDQGDLSDDPFLIEGNEVFGRDLFMFFDDGSGIPPLSQLINSFIQLNPTSNASNVASFDVPHLPNAGFPSPFQGFEAGSLQNFLQTGPMPKTTTAGAVVLSGLNAQALMAEPGGLRAPFYQSRQQIGNFLFVTDGVNKQLHAINSNTFDVIESLDLPDPTGLGLTSDLRILYVSNQGDNSVSVVDADPRSAAFMTEVARVPVGEGPRAVSVAPDNEDVFVLNRIGNTISIIDVGTNAVRRTIAQSGINRPNDMAVGMREVTGGPAFQSGTYHGFITNGGNDTVIVYESGPSGVAGIGFDNILGAVPESDEVGQVDFVKIEDPRGAAFDPAGPLDLFSHTIGAYVAHRNDETGEAMISRVAYARDSNPGQEVFNATSLNPGFGEKVFEITQQYNSQISGIAYDVAIADYNRQLVEESNFNTDSALYNGGSTIKNANGITIPRNAKYPLADIISPAQSDAPRWEPDRVYLGIQGGFIQVFDIQTSIRLKTILTNGEPTVLASYFSQ